MLGSMAVKLRWNHDQGIEPSIYCQKPQVLQVQQLHTSTIYGLQLVTASAADEAMLKDVHDDQYLHLMRTSPKTMAQVGCCLCFSLAFATLFEELLCCCLQQVGFERLNWSL